MYYRLIWGRAQPTDRPRPRSLGLRPSLRGRPAITQTILGSRRRKGYTFLHAVFPPINHTYPHRHAPELSSDSRLRTLDYESLLNDKSTTKAKMQKQLFYSMGFLFIYHQSLWSSSPSSPVLAPPSSSCKSPSSSESSSSCACCCSM